MKVTLAGSADRAVGFTAAAVGLAFSLLTARHLLAPVPTFDASSYGASVAVAVARTDVVRRPALRPKVRAATPIRPHVRGRGRRTASQAGQAPRIVRAPSRTTAAAVVRAPLVGSRARSSRSTSFATARASVPNVARARVAAVRAVVAHRVGPSGPSSHDRPTNVAPARPRTHGRPRARATAPAAFRLPARFDVRPALVTVPDASVASLVAADALPTIAPRRRRR